MSKSRELADLLDTGGDVVLGGLDNVPDSDWNTLLNVPAWSNTDTRDASNITAGTLPNARIVDLPNAQVLGLATSATTDTTNADNIGSGTMDAARLGSGVINKARLGTGSGSSSNYLRGDGVWTTACGSGTLNSLNALGELELTHDTWPPTGTPFGNCNCGGPTRKYYELTNSGQTMVTSLSGTQSQCACVCDCACNC